MNRHTLPRALFSALVAGAAAAQPAVALPPSSPPAAAEAPPVRVEVVDESVLAGISGKYFGANMLVGLRIDLISTLHTPADGSAVASGSLLLSWSNGQPRMQVSSDVDALSDGAVTVPDGGQSASGGDSLQVGGIGQVAQIAGDGNRFSNLTAIRFTPDTGSAAGFNGQGAQSASAGPMLARVTFLDGGMQLALEGPAAQMGQQLGRGGIQQFGQIAGNGMVGSNRMQLQIVTAAAPEQWQQQMGVQQALAGLLALPR